MELSKPVTIDERIYNLVTAQKTLDMEGLLDPLLRDRIRQRVVEVLSNLSIDVPVNDEKIERLIRTSQNQSKVINALIKFGSDGQIVSMETLIKAYKGSGAAVTSSYRVELSGIVMVLRDKIDGWAKIVTVKGQGYCLELI